MARGIRLALFFMTLFLNVMVLHSSITVNHFKRLVKSGAILLGGNRALKIYGLLHCAAGKRMKQGNRVFFTNEQEAVALGYRPCGHCLRLKYKEWKKQVVN